MVVTRRLDNGEVVCHQDANTLIPLIEAADAVIGHNLISFDSRVLQTSWGLTIPHCKMVDTLVLSRLELPDRKGGHSLESWGERFGLKKSDYKALYIEFMTATYPGYRHTECEEWDKPQLDIMKDYCIQDTVVTERLYNYIVKQLDKQGFSEQSIQLEHDVARIIGEQEATGVYVDFKAMTELYTTIHDEYSALYKKLEESFPPTEVVLKTKTKYVPFNPGSRQQIIDRLQQKGWKPTRFTEKNNPILDDAELETIDLPEAKLFARLFLLNKRYSQIKQWMQAMKSDGRVHGKVSSCGAVTGRMTHFSPNMAQVPANDAPFGAECRALFTVPHGKKLVGIDASGLELRMLAHYMRDDEYTQEVVDGDVHTKNQQAAGLATRPQAKTFIYAFLYGAGAEKIGSIVGGGAKEGRKLIDDFLNATPALQTLRTKVARMSLKGSLPGLDGRRLHVREAHAALNTLLQGAGAIVMKQALVLFDEAIKEHGYDAKFVLNVHDEWQLECSTQDAEAVGKTGVECIAAAAILLGMRVPLTGEYRIGDNWSETH